MLFKSHQSIHAQQIFTDESQLASMLEFEKALARAEARVGVIPQSAADAVGMSCRPELFDRQALSAASTVSGNIAIPLVQQLTRLVKDATPGNEAYVHWGATSQDVIDTGMVLQLRNSLSLTESAINDLSAVLVQKCGQFATTLMAGRTWLQQAVPITFGLKLAGVLDAMLRHTHRLQELKPRVLVLQFGGAAGTLASLGENGDKVAGALAEELQLGLPAISWHAQRDRVMEVAAFYGLVMSTVGKAAHDLSLMMQTEIGEVVEMSMEGKGGSSTMPHKRNPVAIADILAGAMRVPGLLSTMQYATSSQEHERGLGGWQVEWFTLPDLCITVQNSLEVLCNLLRGLVVNPVAMETNLQATNGLILSESVTMALAQMIGKEQAHHLIHSVCQKAITEDISLKRALLNERAVRSHFSEKQIEDLMDPEQYLGSSSAMIRRVLDQYKRTSTQISTKPDEGGR